VARCVLTAAPPPRGGAARDDAADATNPHAKGSAQCAAAVGAHLDRARALSRSLPAPTTTRTCSEHAARTPHDSIDGAVTKRVGGGGSGSVSCAGRKPLGRALRACARLAREQRGRR